MGFPIPGPNKLALEIYCAATVATCPAGAVNWYWPVYANEFFTSNDCATMLMFKNQRYGPQPFRAAITLICTAVLIAKVFEQPTHAQETALAPETQVAADAAAKQTSPPVTSESVRKLLRELDSKTLKDRDAAEKSLIEMGPTCLGFLPEVDANTSGEMKVRLQRIRQQLQASNIEVFFEPSKVTLAGKMKLTEAIQEISKQTGNKILLEGEGAFASVEVDLNEKESPFWTVVDKVMSQAKLRVSTSAIEDGLTLIPGGDNEANSGPQAYTNGPFRVDMASIQSTLPFNSRLGGQLDLSMMVAWEPRLKPVFLRIPMATLAATIDDNKTLNAPNQQADPEVPLTGGGCVTQIDLQLARPDRTVAKLSKLSGEFVFAVPSEMHKYVFKKFGNGARQAEKFGDVEVVLEGARRNNAVFEMRILVQFDDDQGALESYRGWALSNVAYLLDPKGRRLENAGWQTYAMTPSAVGIAYLFQINGNPDEFQLVYESPGSIARQSVKFELQDIELP